uniref:Uncharacterized protein n=1 Tax=Fagus sylvatica TaxID=28930 RepID=A0A2N9IY06_FAGSY
MAPPIDIYELMGKKSKGASSSKGKGKAKQGAQPKKSKRAIFEVIAPEQPAQSGDSSSALPDEQTQLPQVVEIDETEQVEEPTPKPKRSRVTQGVHTMEARVFHLNELLKDKKAKHNKAVAEVMENATTNYKALEQEHFKALHSMKEAKERARAKAEHRAKMEAEFTQLQEKVRTLKAECIQSIGKAREEGKQEVMGEVRAQLQGVFNRGFRDGWKSTLRKAEVPDSSDLFLRNSTPLPYPEAGLKDLDDEDEEEDEDEANGEPSNQIVDSAPRVADNPPTPSIEA